MSNTAPRTPFDTAMTLVTAHVDIRAGGERGESPMWEILREIVDGGPLACSEVLDQLAGFVASAVATMAEQERLGIREKWERVCLTAYRDDD